MKIGLKVFINIILIYLFKFYFILMNISMIDINKVPPELIIKLIIDINKPKERENFCNSNKRIKKICKDNSTYILGEIFKKMMSQNNNNLIVILIQFH